MAPGGKAFIIFNFPPGVSFCDPVLNLLVPGANHSVGAQIEFCVQQIAALPRGVIVQSVLRTRGRLSFSGSHPRQNPKI